MKTHEQTAASTTTQEPASPSQQEQIATLSYLIWESEGCPEGRDAEHWAQAEAQLSADAAAARTPGSEG